MSLPWVPGAIRQLLLADAVFASECGGDVLTRLGSTVTYCAQIQVSGGTSLSGDGVAWSPLVQVDGWCAPNAGAGDPERKAWAIAVEAARVLGRARNIPYQNMSYSARVVDGPLPGVDTSRGTSTPLYRAVVRAEIRAHVLAT